MILIQICRTLALVLSKSFLSNCSAAGEEPLFSKNSAVPQEQQDQANIVFRNIDGLHSDVEEKLGLYFKIINLFCTLV